LYYLTTDWCTWYVFFKKSRWPNSGHFDYFLSTFLYVTTYNRKFVWDHEIFFIGMAHTEERTDTCKISPFCFAKNQDSQRSHFITLYQRYIFIGFWKNQDGRTGHFYNILSTLFTSPNGMLTVGGMYRFMMLYSLVSIMLNTDLISWYIHLGLPVSILRSGLTHIIT